MNKMRIIAALYIIVFATFECSAQNPVSIAELQNLALLNNPSIRQFRHRVTAAQGEQIQVGLPANPTLRYLAEDIGADGKSGKHGIALEQEFYTSGKRQRNRAVAGNAVQSATLESDIQQLRIQNDVKARAYEAIAAQNRTVIRLTLLKLAQDANKATETLHQVREISQVDVLQSAIQLNEAKLALANAQNDEAAAYQRLNAVIGTELKMPLQFSDSLDNVVGFQVNWDVWERAYQTLLDSSPELALAYNKSKTAQSILNQQNSNRYPNVFLEGGVAVDTATSETLGSVGFGIPLPLNNRNQGNIKKAQAELSLANEEIQRIRELLRKRLAGAMNRFRNAEQETRFYRDSILPAAQKAWTLNMTAFRQGESSFLDVLISQRKLVEIELQLLSSKLDYALAVTAIDGMLLDGDAE